MGSAERYLERRLESIFARDFFKHFEQDFLNFKRSKQFQGTGAHPGLVAAEGVLAGRGEVAVVPVGQLDGESGLR